jgi:polar amino acid transport system permease protein
VDFDIGIFWDALTSAEFRRGALLTIALACASQVAATIIGFVLALARVSRLAPLRWASGGYVTEEWFTPFLAGFIGLTLSESAYMAEILRSALSAVDPEQRMAAKSLGLTPPQTMRKVVLPQVIRVALPPTGNEFITMLKFTSLTSVISLQELLTVAQQNISATFRYAEFYAAAAVYYLVIVSLLMVVQARIERRYEWRTREGRRTVIPRLRPQAA